MDRNRLLIVIDMITSWDFVGAERVAGGGAAAVEAINRLRGCEQMAVAFANDLSDGFHGSRETALAQGLAGRRPDLVAPLAPEPEEDFIHKGQHSAFYGTPLAHLLRVGEIDEVILTGQVMEQCVLYTALDAHVRGFAITVPTDAVLAREAHLGRAALEMIEANMGGTLTTSDELLEPNALRASGRP